MDSVKKSLSKVLSISEVFLWTESQVTLAWMRAENKEFQTFVENRVQEIRKLTDSRGWYYCNIKSNPADLLTRVQNFSYFQNCDLWWAGPNFLREKRFNDCECFSNFGQDFDKRFNDRDVFSNFEQDFDKSFFHELKSTTCLQQNCKHVFDELAGVSIENIIDTKKSSSTRKLYRITSWVNSLQRI